jgi:hypothetical protein
VSLVSIKPLPPVPPPPTQAELAAKENERLLNSSPGSLQRELKKNDRARVADDDPVVIPYTGKELLQLPARAETRSTIPFFCRISRQRKGNFSCSLRNKALYLLLAVVPALTIKKTLPALTYFKDAEETKFLRLVQFR